MSETGHGFLHAGFLFFRGALKDTDYYCLYELFCHDTTLLLYPASLISGHDRVGNSNHDADCFFFFCLGFSFFGGNARGGERAVAILYHAHVKVVV